MKKSQLSILISAVLLSSTAMATNETLNSGNNISSTKKSYSIIAPEQAQLNSYSGTSKSKVEKRLAEIASLQSKVANRLNQIGVVAKTQLKRLGAISYADLTDSQVKALRAEGYAVQEESIDKLLEVSIQDQSVPWGIERVRSQEAWTTTRGEGVKVCVIDTGLDTGHEDLADNFVAGRNTVDDNDNVEPDHYHGTHVAGTIAAVDNSVGVVGVAPEVDLYIVNAYSSPDGGLPESAILEGLEWCAEQNVDVINMSFGSQENTDAKDIGYRAAYDAGIVLVAASGNSGASKTIKYPARYPYTIAVGSVTESNNIASYSQRGPELDVVAPGEGIYSTEPDNRYRIAGGTSMASPHVAGVAALVIAQTKASGLPVDVDTVKEQINASAVDLGDAGRDDTFGFGRVDARAALDQQPCDGCTYAPYAAFSYVVEELTVSFTNSSSDRDGEVVSYLWDFADGTSSVEQNPVHTYADFGNYTVTLTVTDNDGETGETSKQVEILDIPGGELISGVVENNISAEKSTEYHFWLDVNVPVGEDVTEISFATSGGSGDVDLYVRYGEQATRNDWDYRPYKSGNNEEVIVSQDDLQAGRWYVMLRAYSDYSGVDLVANYSTTVGPDNAAPDANFSVTSNDLTANFSDSSIDSDGTIVSWSWDFGDGNSSSEQNPIHTYAENGTYNVSLTVVDDDGASDTINQAVSVEYVPPCEVDCGQTYSNDTDLVIPDNNWLGVRSSIDVDRSGDSGLVTVKVKINHEDADQLLVKLRAPDGTKWYVHKYEAPNAANGIDKTLTFDASGIDSNGTWKLYLYDRTSGIEGELDSWSITIP